MGLVPELRLIVGEQPPVPELPPQDAQGGFHLLARGNENGDWLGRRDSNPNNRVQSAVSYR